jgi:hypothetical protein
MFRLASAAVIVISFVSCNLYTHREGRKPENSRLYAQKAVFEYLKRSTFFSTTLVGKGKIKIEPLLCTRGRLIVNGKAYFEQPMRSSLLQYPFPEKKSRLVIPDSLLWKYTYTDGDKDYENDYAIIHQFSSLINSKESNIFLIEHHVWANGCLDGYCVRFLSRGYLKFKIESDKITYIDTEVLYGQVDFIGLGSFLERRMENAQPGEKMTKFGN